MKTQNMKLLDLKTGKYLELGKDWVYGGEHIIVSKCNIGYEVYEAIQHNNSEKLYAYDNDCLVTEELNEQLKALCEETGAVVYGGRYVLLSCETWLTKDKISVELMQGHIFRRKLSSLKYYEETPIFLIDKETLMKLSGIKDDYTTYSFETSCYSREFLSTTLLKSLFRGNIFEEYSKQLRNEPNKFDELNQHFK